MNAVEFEPHRKRILGLAYRMTGSVATAEDVVQETWLRWTRAERVEQPHGWLTTVATRLCLDEQRSARARRETHAGPWLPEPWIEAEPPEPGWPGESLSMAFLVMLEELSPRERAAFLLREVFEEPYERVAAALDTTESTARQWVRRAHAALDADRPRFDADPIAQAALLAAFGVAVRGGDLAALERLLAHDVVATSDGGGRVSAARRPIHGASSVARFLLGVARKAPAELVVSPAWVNGQIGLVARAAGPAGQVVLVASISIRDGRIVRYDAVLDPLKLR
ncbi:MAG: RNA polymerase sigma factor SigJ [Myxococcota bacterium]